MVPGTVSPRERRNMSDGLIVAETSTDPANCSRNWGNPRTGSVLTSPRFWSHFVSTVSCGAVETRFRNSPTFNIRKGSVLP